MRALAPSGHASRSTAARSSKGKPFTLTIDLETCRLVLSQRVFFDNGSSPETRRLISLQGRRAHLLMPVVLELLHKAGFSVARLEEKRAGRVRLLEHLGARLALLLWAAAPVQKPSRISLVHAGILGMSDEQLYCWYAKAEGAEEDRRRWYREKALKALRILLAGE